MKILKPKYLLFLRVIVLDDGFILLESSSNCPPDKSNLYKLDLNLNTVWEAKVYPSHRYVNVYLDDSVLKVYDGSGEAILNPCTGELTNWVLTK